jgi:hypothetical protein
MNTGVFEMDKFEYTHLIQERFERGSIWSIVSENKKERLDFLDDVKTLTVLNAIGELGWEVVALESKVYLLKRKIS